MSLSNRNVKKLLKKMSTLQARLNQQHHPRKRSILSVSIKKPFKLEEAQTNTGAGLFKWKTLIAKIKLLKSK